MAVCVLVSFVVGYGVSFVSRTESPPPEARIQVADFRVAIPEGETTITITSRDPTAQQLGQLKLERRGELLHDAVMENRAVEFAPHDKQTEQRLKDYYLDVRLYFRQISYEYSSH